MTAWKRIYREVGARASRDDHAEPYARAALLIGVSVSAALLLIGLLLSLIRHEPRPDEPPSLRVLVNGLTAVHGVSFLYLGLLALAATPILRVIAMVGVYLRRAEIFMLTVSLIVLALLVVAVILGTG